MRSGAEEPLKSPAVRDDDEPMTQTMTETGTVDIHSDAFLRALMRKQLKLSTACAAAFLIVLLGLPAANFLLPELMATRVFGFTLTWLILGVSFFPAVWLIAFVFIRRSLALEEEEARAALAGPGESAGQNTPGTPLTRS